MGTSKPLVLYMTSLRDHPHAYGDKFISIGVFCALIGSSPRVWGQGQHAVERYGRYRIIPTRMGTRSLQDFYNVVNKDHPHAYGDKIPVLVTVAFSLGSSPRVWGQVSDTLTVTGAARIIPTRMGTSVKVFIVARVR